MSTYKTNRAILDKDENLELILELLSFSGGENTISEDQDTKANEARVIENWDAQSVGGMIRSKGFKQVAATAVPAAGQELDLLMHHIEGVSTTRIYGVTEGDLVYKNGAVLTVQSAAAFTAAKLSHGVSKGDKAWITNSTDNLLYATIGAGIATPADQPTAARERIYYNQFRLIAEGGGKTIYGSRAGTGNWTAADAWSLANDAWNIDLPDNTRGCAPGFPSGQETAVFTPFSAYSVFNAPNITYRKIPHARGCCAPYSIAQGDEGIFFMSEHPTLGVFLWDGTNWIDLTAFNDFVDDVNLDQRIYGVYRNKKYYFIYNETGSGVTYPNRVKIYDTGLGRWMGRPVNSSVADNFGYPTLLRYDNNELYAASSRKEVLYELETTDNSDETENTEANYKTKDFSSADFSVAGGGRFPVDEVRLKLEKLVVTYFGLAGSITIQWTADRGAISGSKTITMSATGDLINTTFNVNSSLLVALSSIPDKTVTFTFPNKAVGRRFNFQILNSATGERVKIRRIKIHAIALEEA